MYMGIMMLGRQKYTAELPVPEPTAFETDMPIEKKNKHTHTHKSPGCDHIPAELIKAGGGTIRAEFYKLWELSRIFKP